MRRDEQWKRRQNRKTEKRLQSTVDVKNETVNEVRQKDASGVHRELLDKWVRIGRLRACYSAMLQTYLCEQEDFHD